MMLSLLFQLASNTTMIVWHKVANDSFEKSFCVNKSKPEKSCHGACMMKKINKVPSEKQDLGNHIPLMNLELSNFICPNSFFEFGNNWVSVYLGVEWVLFLPEQDFYNVVFHPPENRAA